MGAAAGCYQKGTVSNLLKSLSIYFLTGEMNSLPRSFALGRCAEAAGQRSSAHRGRDALHNTIPAKIMTPNMTRSYTKSPSPVPEQVMHHCLQLPAGCKAAPA